MVEETVIRPERGWRLVDAGEMWRYRELLWNLAVRDIKVRYKQTVIGVAWAVLQPVLMMAVFAAVFTALGVYPVSQSVVPYAVSLYCALLPWQLFANALTHSSDSIVVNQQLITKVYFPRIVAPLAPILSGLLDFAIAMVILLGMMVYYGITPTWAMLWLPAWVLLAIAAALAVGLWLAALCALYRDFRYVVPFLIQVGFFISPVVYETGALKLPAGWERVYALNPMVSVLEGFRWSLLGSAPPAAGPMGISVAMVGVLLTGGLVYFRRMERLFADRV